jgi:hypothetical protein
LGDKNLLGDWHLFQIVAVLQKGVSPPKDTFRKSDPREKAEAEIEGKRELGIDPREFDRHDFCKDNRKDENLGKRDHHVPDHPHRGARITISKVTPGVLSDIFSMIIENPDHPLFFR